MTVENHLSTSSHKFNEVIDFAYVNALSVNLKYRFFHSMKNTPLEFFFWSQPCLIDIASRKNKKKPKKTGISPATNIGPKRTKFRQPLSNI